jgi:hypothetical protein
LQIHFDKLAGVDPAMRRREDRLPKSLFATIEQWLDDSGADGLAEWSSTYLAHAGGPEWTSRIRHLSLRFDKITDTIKALIQVTQAISLLVYGGDSLGSMVISPPFDQFELLDQPIIRAGDEQGIRDRWNRRRAEWDRCPATRLKRQGVGLPSRLSGEGCIGALGCCIGALG